MDIKFTGSTKTFQLMFENYKTGNLFIRTFIIRFNALNQTREGKCLTLSIYVTEFNGV